MRPPLLSRREVLAAGLAGGAGLILSACTTAALNKAASVRPAGSDLGAIDHIVFLMQENRSFDHYFGTYRGVDGFDNHPIGDDGVFGQPWPGNTNKAPAGRLLPFRLNTLTSDAECTLDLTHDWGPQHQCWAGGAMTGFVTTHTSPTNEGANGVLTMGYYTRQDIAYHYALADAFTICDAYHCSAMAPTDPNRLHAVSATIDPAGRAGGPAVNNISELGAVSWETMPERLEQAGISWKVYNPKGSIYLPSNPVSIELSDNVLLAFSQYQKPSSALYNKAFYDGSLAADVAAGTLPKVSWIIPPARPYDYDEHPPAPPVFGAWFTNQVLSALVSNPDVWARTVLFVMHDENDGFFDHVAPPTPPPGTPGEYVTVSPLPAAAAGVAGPIGLGFRVPMLVVSPFSRGGYVCSDTFDHTSQLRFIETRFGVEVPNLSAWRRSVTGDLTSALNFKSFDASVPRLPVPSLDDPRVRRECQASQLASVDVNSPAYPVPDPQQMPTQEPGQARRIAAT